MDRRTKIVATVGPASWDQGVLEQMIDAGADVFRLNFSHAGPDQQARTIETIRRAATAVGREVAATFPGTVAFGTNLATQPRERHGRTVL